MFHAASIVVAAGKGNRMGADMKKQYMDLEGIPVLIRSIHAFEESQNISGVILVVPADDIGFCSNMIEKYNLKKVIDIVAGGRTRGDSVFNGLKAVPEDVNLVAVHDGARPFLSVEVLDNSLEAAYEYKAAAVAVRVKDTIKMVSDDFIVEDTLPRDRLWAIQTPQVFDRELLVNCYKKAIAEKVFGTDDASIVEYYGYKVKIVEGSYNNIKITTGEDLVIAAAITEK